MFPSVTFSVLALVLPIALAQTSNPDSYGQGLTDYLNSQGYTEAASLLTRANSSSLGQELLAQLPDNNYTVFVPNNAARESGKFTFGRG